jgi:hypothetical protein
MAKKLTKDPDKYLAHKFKDESINTSTVVPLDYRPAPHTYTVRFKREIMKALVEVGSLPKFAHAVKVTCDERKQKFPKSRRALKLDDVKFIRQNPHSWATRADVAELDGMSALNAPNSNQTTAVAAEGNSAVADNESATGTAQPLHTANTADNASTIAGIRIKTAEERENKEDTTRPSLSALAANHAAVFAGNSLRAVRENESVDGSTSRSFAAAAGRPAGVALSKPLETIEAGESDVFTPSLPAPLANVGRKMRKVTRSQKKESSGDAKVNVSNVAIPGECKCPIANITQADHVFAACDRATADLAKVRRAIERDDTETSSMLLYAHRVVAGLTDSLDEFEKADQDELARIRENIARVQDKIARIG